MMKGKRSSPKMEKGGFRSWRAHNSWKTLFAIAVCFVLATSMLMLDQVFQAARIHAVHNSDLSDRPDLSSKLEQQGHAGLISVRDIVAFPGEVLLVVEVASGWKRPRKEDVMCVFGKNYKTGVFTIEWKDESHSTLAVRCEHPPQEVLLETNREATIHLKNSNSPLPSKVHYNTNSSWTPLVYDTVNDQDSVLLFVKGLVDHKGKPENFSKSLRSLHCRFGEEARSKVKVIAQEVVRCELPPQGVMKLVEGQKISLFVPKMGLLPSVAYFTAPKETATVVSGEKQFQFCACTMLWNQGPFLREWITYHGFLGIERWYLYDNNSDDDIEEVLGGLQSAYNVSRHPWPWIKTQEAGFSHGVVRARAECDWLLFVDVDEFVYPVKDLMELVYGELDRNGTKMPKTWVERPTNWDEVAELAASGNRTSVLRRLINRALKRADEKGKKVGEVRLVCHNFGPSGLAKAPEDGVTTGYTCRMQWPERHKSFLYLDAVSDSLLNVVHHFALKPQYKQVAVHARIGVINHYKFQAWEVFKAKFVRRVATYVVDWRAQTANSHDRAPGLGLDAVEPPDWPQRYCEEEDVGLKNFTENVFRHPQTKLMPWQQPLQQSM